MEKTFNFGEDSLKLNKTILCGIVNVTPDSFSDGGRWHSTEKAIEHGLELVEQGAEILDIGGESTRPGSDPVPSEEEFERIKEVIIGLKEKTDVPISVDTWKADVAKWALEAGADIINDITGLFGDPDMAKVVGKKRAGLIIMHNPTLYRPDHPSSKIFPVFGEGQNAFTKEEQMMMNSTEIETSMMMFFDKSLKKAKSAGILKNQIMLDPGIGFGLTRRENFVLCNSFPLLKKEGYFSFVGVSRKRFIASLLEENGYNLKGEEEMNHELKDLGGAVLTALATYEGVDVLRVHDVEKHRISQIIANAVRLAEEDEDLDLPEYK